MSNSKLSDWYPLVPDRRSGGKSKSKSKSKSKNLDATQYERETTQVLVDYRTVSDSIGLSELFYYKTMLRQ